jgi:hypothetical protein
MTQRLSASYEPDSGSDGTGKLTVTVRAGGFAGTGSAWFQERELLELARRLSATYPLPPEGLPALRGGYWSDATPGTLAQPHVELRFYPLGPLGTVACRVELATPVEQTDRASAQASVGVELLTSYEPLAKFGHSLEALVLRRASEAVLEGHTA